MGISIKTAKEIREQLDMACLVIFSVDHDGVQHVATHGDTEIDAKQAADFGDNIKSVLNWDSSKRNQEPLERICGNCSYCEWFNGCSSKYHLCMIERKSVEIKCDRRACRHFEPNR